jgi:hypothetical protein
MEQGKSMSLGLLPPRFVGAVPEACAATMVLADGSIEKVDGGLAGEVFGDALEIH